MKEFVNVALAIGLLFIGFVIGLLCNFNEIKVDLTTDTLHHRGSIDLSHSGYMSTD